MAMTSWQRVFEPQSLSRSATPLAMAAAVFLATPEAFASPSTLGRATQDVIEIDRPAAINSGVVCADGFEFYEISRLRRRPHVDAKAINRLVHRGVCDGHGGVRAELSTTHGFTCAVGSELELPRYSTFEEILAGSAKRCEASKSCPLGDTRCGDEEARWIVGAFPDLPIEDVMPATSGIKHNAELDRLLGLLAAARALDVGIVPAMVGRAGHLLFELEINQPQRAEGEGDHHDLTMKLAYHRTVDACMPTPDEATRCTEEMASVAEPLDFSRLFQSQNPAGFKRVLDGVRQRAQRRLSEPDRSVMLGALSVAEYSAEFWRHHARGDSRVDAGECVSASFGASITSGLAGRTEGRDSTLLGVTLGSVVSVVMRSPIELLAAVGGSPEELQGHEQLRYATLREAF